MNHLLFDSWNSILRTTVLGILAYITLVLMLRASGKRTLSKMNAFDFVVTIALGSTLASVLLSKDSSLAQGAAAFGVLILLQFIVTWLSVRSTWVRKVIVGEPQILFYRGQYFERALRSSRVTREEVFASIRASGHSDLSLVHAVVIETDASFSVLGYPSKAEDTLAGVKGYKDSDAPSI